MLKKLSFLASASICRRSPEYKIAYEFASKIVEHGFMVITGAGGGVMEAGNRGAGKDKSFGNITLPFEQAANSYIG